jgi:hypothetical protein
MGKKRSPIKPKKVVKAPQLKIEAPSDVSTPAATAELPFSEPVDPESPRVEDPSEPELHDQIQTPENEPETPEASQTDLSGRESRLDAVAKDYVAERRNYDFFLHRVSKKLTEEQAQSKSIQTDLNDMLGSVSKLLSEIECIYSNPDEYQTPFVPSKARGPPLPSQDEIFKRAVKAGQIHGKFNS